MEMGCVGKVRRDRPELCESSTESRRPGTRRPVELITREMGTPAEERKGKEVLAPVLGSTKLPKQGPHPRAMAKGPACLVRLHPFPHLLFPRPRNAGWDEERRGVATVRGPETALSSGPLLPMIAPPLPCRLRRSWSRAEKGHPPIPPLTLVLAVNRQALGLAEMCIWVRYTPQFGNAYSCLAFLWFPFPSHWKCTFHTIPGKPELDLGFTIF